MIITDEMIEIANKSKSKCSIDFEKLSFYQDLMNSINKEYSNDDIESLSWVLMELARNVEYVTIPNRLIKKYKANIELTRDYRRNNIRVSISEVYYLPYSDGTHKYKYSSIVHRVGFLEPFYMGNKEMIKVIFEKFEELANEFNVNNKQECIEAIEIYTKCKRYEIL